MKGQIIGLALLAASSGAADCPQLSGTYRCEGDSPIGQEVTIEHTKGDGYDLFALSGVESVIVDGKIKIDEWVVPQAAGGLMLTQASCEDNAVVVRVGLHLGFLEEQRFSKNEEGNLVSEVLGAGRNGGDFEEGLFGTLEKDAEEIMDKTEDRDEALSLVKKLIEENALANWKAAAKNGLLQSVRVECRKK